MDSITAECPTPHPEQKQNRCGPDNLREVGLFLVKRPDDNRASGYILPISALLTHFAGALREQRSSLFHYKHRGQSLFEWVSALVSLLFLMSGCGTPGAPTVPSLHLPEPAADLRAARSGDQVTLTWTMPKRSTDKLMLRGPQMARLSRTLGSSNPETVALLSFSPAIAARYTDKLPHDLTTGPLRLLTYRVELQNPEGKSAGGSNAVYSAAGAAPVPLNGLTATTQANGVLLHWEVKADDHASSNVETLVRIRRTLNENTANENSAAIQRDGVAHEPINAASKKGKPSSPIEAAEQTLVVRQSPVDGTARDESARLDRHYSYSAERVFTFTAEGHSIEVAGVASSPVAVDTKDVFPPQAPEDLAAIAVPGQGAVDLSWTPNSEPDLAGYAVYRSDVSGTWVRISVAGEVVAPEFRDTAVSPNHHYSYAVTALDRSGNESKRSAAAEATLP